MNRQFRFRFEPGGQGGKRFDEAAREHTIAGQHITDPVAENPLHDSGQQTIAEPVALPVSGGDVGDPGAVDHIQAVLRQQAKHRGCRPRVVGIVAIHQNVCIRLDIGEHAADDVAFALQRFMPHDRSGGPGHARGIVAGVVVVDVNRRLGQRGAKIGDHFRDGDRFVVTGDQHGDAHPP